MNDVERRTILTAIALFTILGPSIVFVALAIWRMVQAFGRFGQAADNMRRRLLLNLVFLGLMGVCFFLAFEEIRPIGDQSDRGFVFMLGFICYLWTCGYAFLSWNLWESGSGRRARRRPTSDDAEVTAETPIIVTALEALAVPIPTIRIVHVFGDDSDPLVAPRPSQSTAA